MNTMSRHRSNIAQMPHERSVFTGKFRAQSRAPDHPRKTQDNDPMQGKCWADVKVVGHLCGSIGPMSSVSQDVLCQFCIAVSHTIAQVCQDVRHN